MVSLQTQLWSLLVWATCYTAAATGSSDSTRTTSSPTPASDSSKWFEATSTSTTSTSGSAPDSTRHESSQTLHQSASPKAQLDPIKNYCARFMHQSTVKGDTLYIDGGQETFADVLPNGTQLLGANHTITSGYNNNLIAIDLAQPWDWHLSVPQAALKKTANPETGTPPPQVISGALFAGQSHDSRIYLYGGTTNWWNVNFPGFEQPSAKLYALWAYDTLSQVWSQYDISAQSPWRPSNGISVAAPEVGLAFYLNGQLDSGSSAETTIFGDSVKIFLKGMIVLNTTDQSAVNISTDAMSGDRPHTRGAAAYIPDLGGSGILAIFGGTYKQFDDLSKDETVNYIGMDEIDIFDVGAYLRSGTRLWYKQIATGDVPEPRAYFCTVMVSAVDNTTHNIYMYSGQGKTKTFDDIYVLSIPSFVWTKITTGDSPRYGHTCHLIGDQMLTVGGKGDYDFNSTCDWENKGVAIFNVSSLNWGSLFKPENETIPYNMPPALQTAIKGVNGTIPLIRPANGWSDPELGRVFADPQLLQSHKLGAGAITGIAIGSLVALALTIAVLWLSWRKWFSHGQSQDVTPTQGTMEWVPLDRPKAQPISTSTSQNSMMVQTTAVSP